MTIPRVVIIGSGFGGSVMACRLAESGRYRVWVLERGQREGRFREDVDPVDLYISITSLTAHYVSHHHTFEALFDRKLMTPARVRARLEHAADMVLGYLIAREPKRRTKSR